MGGNNWDIQLMQDRISKFCQLCHEQNIEIKVFIDGGYGSSEAIEKYKTR